MFNLKNSAQLGLALLVCSISFNTNAIENTNTTDSPKKAANSYNELISKYNFLLDQQRQSRLELLSKIEVSRNALKKKQVEAYQQSLLKKKELEQKKISLYKEIKTERTANKSSFTGFKSRELIIKEIDERRAIHLKEIKDRRAKIHKKMEKQRSEMAKYRQGA